MNIHKERWIMNKMRKIMAALAALPMSLVGLALPASAPAAPASVPEDGLLAQYSFASKPSDGKTVENTAAGSSFGPAVAQNPTDGYWTDKAFTLSGGPHDGNGSWVKLPADLLKGKKSATVQMEVKADPSMLSTFHFMWNIGNSSNNEYVFSALACLNGRTPLAGIKAFGTETLVQSPSCTARGNEWMSVTATFDSSGDTNTAKLYIDGKQVASGKVPATPADVADQSLDTIAYSPWGDMDFKGAVSTFRVYDTALKPEQVDAINQVDAQVHGDEIAGSVIDGLGFSDQSVDTNYLALPTAGGRVTWHSSDTDVITDKGVVTQPAKGSASKTVTMTASTTIRGITRSKSYTITVEPTSKTADDVLAEKAKGYVIPPVLADGQTLPAAIKGTSLQLSGDKNVSVSADRSVHAADGKLRSGTITAKISADGAAAPVSKSFSVRVLPKSDSQTLLAYDRNATSENEANNGDIAHSMHLALKADKDAKYTPLNENYGIFFPLSADAQPLNMNTVDHARSLKDPSVLYMKDGSYGVLSVRTNRGTDTSDPSARGKVLFVPSKDLLSYQEQENSASLIDLGERNGVNQPYGVYDSASDKYLVGWKDDAGVAKYTVFDNLTDKTSHHGDVMVGDFSSVGRVTASTAARGSSDGANGVDDFRGGFTIPVDNATVKALNVRFGRIKNTGVSNLKTVSVDKGSDKSAIKLPKNVDLTYSDGSTGSLPVASWDTSALDTSKAGEYTVTGKVKQTEYQVPFAEERADPSIDKWQWKHMVDGKETTQIKYLMIATNDIYGDCSWQHGTPHMPLRMADSIEALADTPNEASGMIDSNGYNAKEHVILQKGDKDADGVPIEHSFWAPEIHEINGRLTILFMAGYGTNWTNGKAVYMQLKQDASGYDMDPTQASSWDAPRAITRANGDPLALDANHNVGMSLDMTYFKDGDGQSYYAWQQLGATYIAKMNPTDPAHVTTDPVRIVAPEYAWNVTIAEGPNVTMRNGKLYLMYSGSSVGKTYTTGLAVADAKGSDLTDPKSWSNLNYPIQKSGIFNGKWQLGTGHGMWSEDEDGNQIYVFHAYANTTTGLRNYSGRDTFVRRVHWAADGMPVFDMDAAEELSKPTVSFKVKVVDQSIDGGHGAGAGQNPGSDHNGNGGQAANVPSTSGSSVPSSTAVAKSLSRTGAAVLTVVAAALVCAAIAVGLLAVGKVRQGKEHEA